MQDSKTSLRAVSEPLSMRGIWSQKPGHICGIPMPAQRRPHVSVTQSLPNCPLEDKYNVESPSPSDPEIVHSSECKSSEKAKPACIMATQEHPHQEVKSKQGEPIHEGDHVYTKIRGGRHEGDVSSISLRPLSRLCGGPFSAFLVRRCRLIAFNIG
jgi:hypothetical protein